MADPVTVFTAFHRQNPHVYVEFCRLARKLKDQGKKRDSALGIIYVIRFDSPLQTDGSEFKIPNTVAPFYARMLAIEEPWFADFFEFRESVAATVDLSEFVRPPGHLI